MYISNLNTYCVGHLLSFLSKEEVSLFSEDFPMHKEATNSYWRKIRAVDFNKMTTRDINAFLQNMSLCLNLNELKISKLKNDDMAHNFKHFPPALEVLDISRVVLFPKGSISLRSCHNLKSLTVRIPMNCRLYPFRGFFSKKMQLNHLEISAYFTTRGSSNGCLGRYNSSVLKNYNRMLSRGTFLEVVAETQTSLKSLRVSKVDDKCMDKVFFNNPNLEDVTFTNSNLTGSCLRRLPRTLKRLDLSFCNLNSTYILMQCLERWKLESLGVTNWRPNFLEILTARAPTLQEIIINCDNKRVRSLQSVTELRLLKCLRLVEMHGEEDANLRTIIQSCVNLELLELQGRGVVLSDGLFESIAALPKLKEIILMNGRRTIMNYNPWMDHLSNSKSLTDVTLRFFSQILNKQDILTLIRGSSILTKLNLEGCAIPVVFTPEINEILTKQKNRTNELHLTIQSIKFSSENIPEDISYPLLKVKFITF